MANKIWAYQADKEIIAGLDYEKAGNNPGHTISRKVIFSLDGKQKFSFFEEDILRGRKGGLIRAPSPFDYDSFNGHMAPKSLLGFGLGKRRSLGQALQEAQKVEIKRAEQVDGHECLVLESFGSQPEDIVVHGGDENVSDPVMVEKQVELMRSGAFGETDEQLMRVATLNGEPVALIMGAIREEEYRPRYGVISIVGVLPEYRRRGFGSSLSALLISRFRERDCEYAYVGTPRSNQKAIKLYEKLGFRPIFYINFYERMII